MNRCSNRIGPAHRFTLVCGVAMAAAIAVASPRPAHAQWAVTCVNCSTTWTQLLEYGKQAQQLETQLQQYQTQLQQYANMVTNTVALPQQMWGTGQSDIIRCGACPMGRRCFRATRDPS